MNKSDFISKLQETLESVLNHTDEIEESNYDFDNDPDDKDAYVEQRYFPKVGKAFRKILEVFSMLMWMGRFVPLFIVTNCSEARVIEEDGETLIREYDSCAVAGINLETGQKEIRTYSSDVDEGGQYELRGFYIRKSKHTFFVTKEKLPGISARKLTKILTRVFPVCAHMSDEVKTKPLNPADISPEQVPEELQETIVRAYKEIQASLFTAEEIGFPIDPLFSWIHEWNGFFISLEKVVWKRNHAQVLEYGKRGERLVDHQLKFAPDGCEIVEKNGRRIYLGNNGVKAEYDDVVVGQFGVLLIEVKYLGGCVYIDDRGSWTQVKRGSGDVLHLGNPSGQILRHRNLMRRIIGDGVPIYDLIVFAHPQGNIVEGGENCTVPVCRPDEVLAFIEGLTEGDPALDNKMRKQVLKKIDAARV